MVKIPWTETSSWTSSSDATNCMQSAMEKSWNHGTKKMISKERNGSNL